MWVENMRLIERMREFGERRIRGAGKSARLKNVYFCFATDINLSRKSNLDLT